MFYHFGKDTQFWAGHYGSKFTNANVQLFYPNDTSKDHVIGLHSQESLHEDCKQINNCQSPIYQFDRFFHSAVKKYKTKYLIWWIIYLFDEEFHQRKGLVLIPQKNQEQQHKWILISKVLQIWEAVIKAVSKNFFCCENFLFF